jgi:magnesium transporter
MIHAYRNEQGYLRPVSPLPEDISGLVWLDLLEPGKDEEQAIEAALGIGVPTREEMEEIEHSSRLYYEDGAVYMTATLPSHTDSDEPVLAPVSFVLTDRQLLTVRYNEPRAFATLPMRAAKSPVCGDDGATVLVVLLELQIDRLADVLERAGRDIYGISREVFKHKSTKRARATDHQSMLVTIGHKGDLTSNLLECLVSLERMFGFLSHAFQQRQVSRDLRTRVKTLVRDCHSLIEYAGSLSQKVTFLLEATLGLVNIEQNATIKIFSVVAVVFLPPTLIASIYGMNFRVMPELEWLLGYPFALLLMVICAIVPYLYFKYRRWL